MHLDRIPARVIFINLLLVLFLGACQQETLDISTPLVSATSSVKSTSTVFATPLPVKAVIVRLSELASTTPSALPELISNDDTVNDLQSPLAGISIQELNDILSNPFMQPSPGQDDGHHGSDFSFYHYGNLRSINELEIISILPGIISTVILDRPPYGNAIIIETSWYTLSSSTRALAASYEIPDHPNNNTFIQCPQINSIPPAGLGTDLSLYVLYAHMADLPSFSLGDTISQGQIIGRVGNSGMSGNPHLHLETRFGPSHATFPVMAHYDNGVSSEEMANYCYWRTSGYFQLVDPMLFFGLTSQNR